MTEARTMTEAQRQAALEAAAAALGFGSVELMRHYFKEKLLREGLYEALNAKAAKGAARH